MSNAENRTLLFCVVVSAAEERERTPAADGRGRHALFDDAGDGVVVHGPDGGVVHDVNDRFVGLSGLDREAVVGSHVTDLVADDWHPEASVDRLVDGDLDGGATAEWRLKRRDAGPFWAELSASRTERGGETCVSVTVRDVTERREQRRALGERTERLEPLNRIVRHDVRNDMLGSAFRNLLNNAVQHGDGAGAVSGPHPRRRLRRRRVGRGQRPRGERLRRPSRPRGVDPTRFLPRRATLVA